MKSKILSILLLTAFLLLALCACSTKTTEPELVAEPSFDLPGGSYYETGSPMLVSITSETPLAIIYFPLDGTDPSSTSSVYSSPISISATTTIKAKAVLEGRADSKVVSATYTIIPPPFQMVYVPAGTFAMGNTRGGGDSDQLPIHSVSLSPFFMSKYEVTRAEYIAIMNSNPPSGGEEHPVRGVQWYSALKYCNLLSMNEGLTPVYAISGSSDPATWGEPPAPSTAIDPIWDAAICDWSANGYRLPTEAEWEYAARGATNDPDYLYSGSDLLDDVGWCNTAGSMQVGTKAPNALGIYDMSGNVWEWCWDWYDGYSSDSSSNPSGPVSGSHRVRRGGYWQGRASECRVAHRGYYRPSYRGVYVGFRICRSVL